MLTPDPALGPDDTAEQSDSVSLALLVLMERLTPAERAVYVLREAFGHPHREIAGIVGVTEAHGRRLHRRARDHLDAARRPPAPPDGTPGAGSWSGSSAPPGTATWPGWSACSPPTSSRRPTGEGACTPRGRRCAARPR